MCQVFDSRDTTICCAEFALAFEEFSHGEVVEAIGTVEDDALLG